MRIQNSKFVLNSLASNASISKQGETKKRTLIKMKFDTLDVCQNSWFNCHGIKKITFFNY